MPSLQGAWCVTVAVVIAVLFSSTTTASLLSLFNQPSTQKPLSLLPSSDRPHWTLNFSSPNPHLFASLSTLLHQWSNTIFPNGHTLAAVEIPAYTLLYHGLISPPFLDDNDNNNTKPAQPSPPSPEWLAFDAEMSYGIMGSSRNSFLLTYQTTRPVRALYFDGESAALMGLGQLDTQMLLLFGNVTGPSGRSAGSGWDFLGMEYVRAHGLCSWLEEAGLRGPGWGFEGVVRMNAGFEVIWCDFLSPSLRLVSRVNVTAPLLPKDDDDNDDDDVAGTIFEDMAEEKIIRQEQQQQQKVTTTAPSHDYPPLPPQPTKTDRNASPSHPAAPPNMRWGADRAREPFLRAQGWSWFDSATWHYGATRSGPGQGEARARVLSCAVLSYYAPSHHHQPQQQQEEEQARLNLTRDGLWMGTSDEEEDNREAAVKQLARRRRFHHLGNVTADEALVMRGDVERALRNVLHDGGGGGGGHEGCSGADWTLISSEIVQRVTNHLTMLDTKLANFPSGDNDDDDELYRWLFDLRGQSHLFMVPHLEYPSTKTTTSDTWRTPHTELYQTTLARCRYRYTRLLVPDDDEEEERDSSGRNRLSSAEQDIREAVEEVYGTICAVLLTLGFGVEAAWADVVAGEDKNDKRATAAAAAVAAEALSTKAVAWRDNIAELTAWLGWEGQYYGCKETCAWDERCYIPMWPLLHRGGGGGGRRRPPLHGNGTYGGGGGRGPPPGFKMPPRGPWWMGDDTDLWEPKCVNITFIMGEV